MLKQLCRYSVKNLPAGVEAVEAEFEVKVVDVTVVVVVPDVPEGGREIAWFPTV